MGEAPKSATYEAAAAELDAWLQNYAGCLPWTLHNPALDALSRLQNWMDPRPQDVAAVQACMMHVQRVNKYGQ